MSGPVGVIGLRGTGEFTTDFRPTNYRELYTLLEPNGSAPLNALLAMGASEETNDPTYNNFRDELPDRSFNTSTSHNNSTTTLTLTSGDEVGFIVVGTMLVNTATGELMRATANGDTNAYTVAVTRNIGGTSLTMASGDEIIVVGSAFSEGSGSSSAVSFDATLAYNYTQIFKTAFAVTNTAKNTYFRTGNKEDEYASKALKLHMSDIERSMFYGKRAITNGSTSQPLRYTGGLLNTITTVEDCSTHTTPNAWDENSFDRWLIETCFAWGSKEKVVFCGAKVAGHLQQFAKERWAPVQIDNTYGVNVTGYKTFAGTLMVHLHPQFRQISALQSTAFFLDFPYLKYRFMKGRDTSIVENIQGNDEDQVKHQYLTECGLELLQDKPHSIVKNWTTVG
jgi:hypothetical protein